MLTHGFFQDNETECVGGEYAAVEGECDSYTTCSNGVLYTKLCSPGIGLKF
jgi:hypothetical protein